MMMKFTWIGGASFVMDIGGFRVVGDPVTDDAFEVGGARVIRLDSRPDVEMIPADVVCTTCGRNDHVQQTALEQFARARIVGPEGVPGTHLTMGWYEKATVEKEQGKLTVIAVPARPARHNEVGNGYFFRFSGEGHEYTAYWTGDTHFNEDTLRIQRELGHVNLLVVHVGSENGGATSADAKEAMQIVYRMQPNTVIPIHHSTFSHYNEPIREFERRASVTIYDKRLSILKEGESVEKKIAPKRAH